MFVYDYSNIDSHNNSLYHLANYDLLEDLQANPYTFSSEVSEKGGPQTREISTQTDELMTQVRSLTTQTASDAIAQTPASNFSLKNIDFSIISVKDLSQDEFEQMDLEAPEMQPYIQGAGSVHKQNKEYDNSFIGRNLNAVADAVYWMAVTPWTTLYRSEGELLRDITEPTQEIRSSSSWFFYPGGESREVLYGLDHTSTLQTLFVNTPKWLFYEGITSLFTSSQTKTLNLFKVVPHVYKEKIMKVTDDVSYVSEFLAKTTSQVLNDELYNNVEFLAELEDNIRSELDFFLKQTAEMVIHKNATAKTKMRKVLDSMFQKAEQDFPTGGGFLSRSRDYLDSIKMYEERFFRLGDEIANGAINIHTKTFTQAARHLRSDVKGRKQRIEVLMNGLLEVRKLAKDRAEEYLATLQAFDELGTSY